MLVISTATKKAYVAINHDGQNFFSEVDSDCRQSENILKEIDRLLEKNSLSLSDVGNIGVVVGPGSFTGLRIGIALIKGICAGKDHKILPISTLDLIAKAYIEKHKPHKNFYAVMNALSGRFFVAKYDRNGMKKSEERMIDQSELIKIKGEQATLFEEFPLLPNSVQLTPEILLDFALKNEKEEKLTSAEKLTPVYIRKSQAEESWDRPKTS